MAEISHQLAPYHIVIIDVQGTLVGARLQPPIDGWFHCGCMHSVDIVFLRGRLVSADLMHLGLHEVIMIFELRFW